MRSSTSPKPKPTAPAASGTGTTRSPRPPACEQPPAHPPPPRSPFDADAHTPSSYLLSVAYHKLWLLPACTPSTLRYGNLLATLLTALVAADCRHLLGVRAAEQEGKTPAREISAYAFQTGVNIALFPVIFFFSGLYYTDVVSTLVVLVAYRNHLVRVGSVAPGVGRDVWTVVVGVTALVMRQTNVFWVVVYMGGLEAVHVVRSARPSGEGVFAMLHDPPLNRSGPEGTSPPVVINWCLLTTNQTGSSVP